MVNSVYYIGIYEIEDLFMLEFKSSPPHGVSGMRGYRSFLGYDRRRVCEIICLEQILMCLVDSC